MGYRKTGHESLPYKYSRKLCALFGLHGFMATMVKTVCGLFFQMNDWSFMHILKEDWQLKLYSKGSFYYLEGFH